jgi:SAM-dependent methyltransferase
MNDTSLGRRPAAISQVRDALSWRWRFVLRPSLKRLLGIQDVQWTRVVMNRECVRFARTLPVDRLDVLEISPGDSHWQDFGFGSYRRTMYQDYDVCAEPLRIEAFDLIIAEQVLEHVRQPHCAVRNVHHMLRPGGWFLVSTPFLLGLHAYPDDYGRWTEQGLKELLIAGGFDAAEIRTASWGNRACVRANFKRYPSWIPWWHSLRNEAAFPLVVWAFAQRSRSGGA